MYQVIDIGNIPDDILLSFDQLPEDNYLHNDDMVFRKRRYHMGNLAKSEIIWREKNKAFVQSKELNEYSGDIKRKFEPVTKEVRNYLGKKLIPLITRSLPKNNYEIGLHQIRTLTNNKNMGKPAPEGAHQDGFDYVCVICANYHNITGGNSLLVNPLNHKEALFNTILTPSEAILFDDRIYAHYASPIVPLLPGDGHRDVFVITFMRQSKKHTTL